MANYLQRTVRGYIDNPDVIKRYIRLEEAQKVFKETYPDMEDILPFAYAAGAVYQLTL